MKSTDATHARGAALKLHSVYKVYGNNVVSNDVTMEIQPGEFVTLLGASGSGKTTLLRMVAGFLEPNAGTIELDGVDITTVPVHKRNIGMVFQNYALFPHMNVLKNVMFPLEMHKVPRSERKSLAREALAAVKLEGFEERKASQLSGGQQQRVALARAIVMKPRLLLMDEPLGALDRRLREAMQIEILRLSRDLGLTVINVTHDQEEAFTMSDRIALLADGNLVQFDSPQQLYAAPTNATVAEFLGESNMFYGTVEIRDGRHFITAEEVDIEFVPSGDDLLQQGESAVGVLRPWAVDIVAEEAPHLAEGIVEAVIYAGESQKIIVRSSADREYIVRRPLQDQMPVSEGVRVALNWNPGHVVTTRSIGSN